jgi:chromosome segregation ATPase
MARLTKISPYRTGSPRFGTKGHVEKWDNSVKVSYLSPEELEEYRSGRKGGRRMVTHDDYLALEKKGLTKKEIAKKLDISVPTLYKRLEVWNKGADVNNPHQDSQEPQKQIEKPSEGQREQEDKSGELVALIATLKAELEDKNDKIASLQGINADRETAYESFKSDYLQLKTQKDEEIEKLKIEVSNEQQQQVALKEKLQESEENMQELLGANENLHKEIVFMNDSVIRSTELLNGASDEVERLTKKYNDLLREVEPLRQLALMKLQQDVSV